MKKIFLVVLALALTAAFAACTDKDAAASQSPNASTEVSAETLPADTTSQEPAVLPETSDEPSTEASADVVTSEEPSVLPDTSAAVTESPLASN